MGAGRGASSGDSPGQLAVSARAPAAGDPAHRPQRCRAGAVPAVADEVAGSPEALTVRPSASAGPRVARGLPAPPAGERALAPLMERPRPPAAPGPPGAAHADDGEAEACAGIFRGLHSETPGTLPLTAGRGRPGRLLPGLV